MLIPLKLITLRLRRAVSSPPSPSGAPVTRSPGMY